ncbi:MAG: cell division protein ZapA [Polyangiaceae bacterium]|nr:cell division protein ZapA [Polyangiaceae bacterium]
MAAKQSISIGGSTYQVYADLPPADLARLSAVVDARLRELLPKGKSATPQTFLLVALSFAHDGELAREAAKEAEAKSAELEEAVDEEIERRRALEAETRDLLRRVLSRIDLALEDDEGDEAEDRPASPT